MITLIAGLSGLVNAAEREGSRIIQKSDVGVRVVTSVVSAQLATDDPNDGEITIKLDDRVKDIEKRLVELEKEFDYLRNNCSELSKTGKYEEYMKMFEEKLNSLCDSSKAYVSRLDSKAELLIKKLELKCRLRNEQIELIENDITDLAKQQDKLKKQLDTMPITSPEFVSLKTEFYKKQWKLRSLKAKSAALKLQNATERLIVSTFFNAKALEELKSEFSKQKLELENRRASPMKD